MSTLMNRRVAISSECIDLHSTLFVEFERINVRLLTTNGSGIRALLALIRGRNYIN